MYVRICTDRFISYKYLVFSFETFNFISLFFFMFHSIAHTPPLCFFFYACVYSCLQGYLVSGLCLVRALHIEASSKYSLSDYTFGPHSTPNPSTQPKLVLLK